MRKFALLLLFGILAGGIARADSTFVSAGNVSGDWTSPGSPFVIEGVVRVLPSDTLRIGSGVTVFFAGSHRIEVGGVLLVQGNSRDSVVFTADTVSNPDGWGGIRLTNPTGITRLDYAVIEHGRSFADGDFGYGGAIFCSNGSAVISNSSIRFSRASSGGGIYCKDHSSMSLAHCTIRDNIAQDGLGGAIVMLNASLLNISDCTIMRNYAVYGAGIGLDASRATITDSRIMKNSTGIWGGGIYAAAAGITISHCVISGNSSIGGGGIDGRVDVQLNMDHCLITDNSAMRSGAWGPGGGIALQGGDQSITNCTFANNSAGSGGAIYCSTTLNITNCIISRQTNGSGLYFPYGGAQVSYCCLAENAGGDFGGALLPRELGLVSQTNVNGDSCDPFMNLYLDPAFDQGATVGYYLSAESPCINAGDPHSPRDPDGSIADLGVYWFDPSPVSPPAREIPGKTELACAYPNPFNPSTTFPLEIARESRVTLKIYDLMGRDVATLVNGRLQAGTYAFRWNAEGWPSGTYFAVMITPDLRQTQKILLLK